MTPLGWPTALTVVCTTVRCRSAGQRRRFRPRMPTLGVVEVPRLCCATCGSDLHIEEGPGVLHTCKSCTTQYAESLDCCPSCGSTERVAASGGGDSAEADSDDEDDEEDDMAKITVHGGATNAADQPPAEVVAEPGPELVDLPEGNLVEPDDQGEEADTDAEQPADETAEVEAKPRKRAAKKAAA